MESAFEFGIWSSDLQTEILNFKPQRLPEEGFAETEQKRRSPEGKSLLSRIKILRPPSKRRRRGRNISREIYLLLTLLLSRLHPISSNNYFSSIQYELSVRSWAKEACAAATEKSDLTMLIVLNLLFPWIISPMVSLRSQKVQVVLYHNFFFLTNCLTGSFFFTNSCFGFFCKPQSTHRGPKLLVMSLNVVFTFVCVLFCNMNVCQM